MSKYIFTNGKDVKVLPVPKGSLIFGNGAEIDEYKFDGGMDSIQLKIGGWWFGRDEIDDLIEFLQAAKAQLKEVE